MSAASSWTGTTTDSSGTDSSGTDSSGAPARAAIAPAFDELSRSVILARIVSHPPGAVVAPSGAYFEPCI